MSHQIDRLREGLRFKLVNIESGPDGLKAKIDRKAKQTERDIQKYLQKLQRRIEHDRTKLLASEANVKSWVEDRKIVIIHMIADWKAKCETGKLQNGAEKAKQYAAAATQLVLAAVDEAEQAALEAWLA